MTDEKIRENRLRRMAERQGLALQKSRRRDPRAMDYGRYWLTLAEGPDPRPDLDRRRLVARPQAGHTLDEIETMLTGEAADDAS
jgi:hypothetical protein